MKKPDDFTKYKFRALKVYNSEEWLVNSQKKYRTVFDRNETRYVWAEFSFFNKLFDEDDWDAKIELKAFDDKNKELCSLNADRTIYKDDNIVYVRKGWGNDTVGEFWKRGTYRWEAWLDGEMIEKRTFYIEDEGVVTQASNPYFNLKNIKLYEGGYNDYLLKDAKYYKEFDTNNTRYIWIEFKAENLITDYDYWACELIFNFKTHSGELKASVDKLIFVYPQDTEISTAVGWGADKNGTWLQDKFYVEVVFMDQIIAVVPFVVSEEFIELEEGEEMVISAGYAGTTTPTDAKTEITPESLDQVMAELDGLIGLEEIKGQIREYTNYLNFLKIRKEKGFEESQKINLHAVFTGNPGTGKTTVAHMLGKIYKQLGLLSRGHVHEVDRSDIVGEYIGQTAPKVKEAIKKAKGGILFIDEAYSLYRSGEDGKDFGREVIEILIKEMSSSRGEFAVIVAGYPQEMQTFINSNPGLKSRFNKYYNFPDYVPQELMEITTYATEKRGVTLTEEAKAYIYQKLVDAYRDRDKSFGNARFAISIIEEAKMNMGLRLMKSENLNDLTEEELSTIDADDVKKIFGERTQKVADIPVDEDLLRESLSELKSLIGLEKVKTEIDELVKLVRFYREIGKDVRKVFSLHTIFTGNPGTGKTTVSRILAKIYKALGILERGHLVECDRERLIGGYVGQTAIKTAKAIDDSMGGVLFIDEAYSLTAGGSGDFGREAVETILKRMEDKRGEFVVIAAGYPDNMREFLESNPGLKSRFDRVINFEDYNADELFSIATAMLLVENIQPDEEATEHIKNYLQSIIEEKDKYFGNARTVRKMVEEAIKNQHLRLAQVPAKKRTEVMLRTLTLEDVTEFEAQNVARKSNRIGFGFKQT